MQRREYLTRSEGMLNTLSPKDIYKYLPKENCGKCGTTCMGFAVKLLIQKAYLSECQLLKEPKYISANIELKKLLAPLLKARKTKLIIYGELCNGCGNCVVVCPPNASCSLEASGGKGPLSSEVVTKMHDGIVAEINLDSCRRAVYDIESEPCRLCIDACPFKAIEFM